MVLAELGWDDELDGELLEESRAVLSEMLKAGEVKFPRAVIPEDADMDDVGVVGFSDGGDPASACCLYVRTKKKESEGNYTVRLLAGKARVTPSSKKDSRLRNSTPRCELRGMLYLHWLLTALLRGFPRLPKYVFFATDSECTISSIEAQDRILQSWFTNRVSEIVDHS